MIEEASINDGLGSSTIANDCSTSNNYRAIFSLLWQFCGKRLKSFTTTRFDPKLRQQSRHDSLDTQVSLPYHEQGLSQEHYISRLLVKRLVYKAASNPQAEVSLGSTLSISQRSARIVRCRLTAKQMNQGGALRGMRHSICSTASDQFLGRERPRGLWGLSCSEVEKFHFSLKANKGRSLSASLRDGS